MIIEINKKKLEKTLAIMDLCDFPCSECPIKGEYCDTHPFDTYHKSCSELCLQWLTEK